MNYGKYAFSGVRMQGPTRPRSYAERPSSSNPPFLYRMCNITSSAIDLASGSAWHLAIFDDGNDN